MSRSLLISNFILFQLGWFACVLGGANQLGWVGSLIALLVIAVHLSRAAQPRVELYLLVLALGIGLLFESLLTLSGLSSYPDGVLISGLPPHWMLLMWPLFATTLNVSLRWIKALPLIQVAVLAAVMAPLSYFAGQRLGAITFSDTQSALLSIATGWGVLFPLLVVAARRFNGYALQATRLPPDKRA